MNRYIPSLVAASLKPWQIRSQTLSVSVRHLFSHSSHACMAKCNAGLGIFGGRSHDLSIRSCFPFLYEYEQKHGSIGAGILKEMLGSRSSRSKQEENLSPAVREMQKMKVYSFKEGTETLPKALAQRIRSDENTDILLNTGVQQIDQVCSLIILSTVYCLTPSFRSKLMGLSP